MGDKRATREAFGETLVELAREGRDDIVALDADLAKSTTTAMFAAAHPDRFFDIGIAEQNMVGVAAGLALAGFTPFTGSFAVFATGRAYDQVRNTVCYSELGVKLCPTHAGVTVGPDGGSHQMLEDVALMRALPGMRVFVPADIVAAKACIRIAAENPGPFYVRLGRAAVRVLHAGDTPFEVGRAHVAVVGSDVTLVASGVMVERALDAARLLGSEGIVAEVLDCWSVKPLDADTIRASAAKTGAVVTCEEHSVIGGLGAAVAEALEASPVPMRRVGVRDTFGTSGEPEELMRHFALTAEDIASAAREVLGKG